MSEEYAPHLLDEIGTAGMLARVAANLASLNDVVAILAREVSDDPEFVKLVADTLAGHSAGLGFEHGSRAAP